MAAFTSLTPDVQERILIVLSRVGLLPFKLRLVCKTWNSLIVPIKFARWEVKRLDEHMNAAKLKSMTWPDSWVYSKIRKYTRTILVRRHVHGDFGGFLNGLKSIRAIDIDPDDGCRGGLAWENIAEPIFNNWLPAYLVRLTSISLQSVKIIDFLEMIEPKDIPRLKWFRTDSYCGEDHSKMPYRCTRASRMLVAFIRSYKMLEKVNIRLTDAYVGTDLDLAQAVCMTLQCSQRVPSHLPLVERMADSCLYSCRLKKADSGSSAFETLAQA